MPNYGDIILGNMKWECRDDTLVVKCGDNYRIKYQIISLDSQKFVLKDFHRLWGWDTLTFTVAQQQQPKGLDILIKRSVSSPH
jgi:hypothetical protein